MSTPTHQPSVEPRGRYRSIAGALDSLPLTRAQLWVMALVMAGMFFDTLQQDAPGAIGPQLKDALHIGNTDLVTINTLTVVGGIVGRLVGGYLADRKGRRFSLSFNLLIYTVGGLLSAVAPNFGVMLVSRFIVGIGLGGEFTIGLTLVSEIVATKRRGTAVGSMGFASGGIGNFVAYGLFVVVLGPLNNALGGDLFSWRWLLVVLAIPAVLVVFYRRFLPESPRFLVESGRVQEANRALTILASDDIRKRPTDAEVIPFLDTESAVEVGPRVSPTEIFTKHLLRRTVAIGIASWMAFGAQVTLLVLLPTLLVSKGYSVSSSLIFTLIMYGGSMLGALVAALVAAKLPRRTTVAIAGVLGCLSAIAFAEFANGAAGILVYGSIFQFFSLFLNSTLALWSPELYPTRIRALGCSTVNGVGNVAGALMPFAAVFIFGHSGVGGVFLMIAVMYTILAVSARFAPETLGRSLEVINELVETEAATDTPEATTT
ncbi:MAG TPA: MFS transporter [Pseudonocardiaceae bacterium]|nr:MFS transporter [Pseudonocardiaceae bacterium]